MAQKREEKNQNNILEEGASKEIHARNIYTGVSDPDVSWNSHKINGAMPSSGCLPNGSRGYLEKERRKYRSYL